MKTHKGQTTIVNLIMIMVTAMVLFVAVIPVLEPEIESFAANHSNGTNMDSAMVTLAQMLPFLLLVTIIISAIVVVFPRREGV